LEVTIRGLPDIKNPPSSLINPFNPQESLSLKFSWPVYRCMCCERRGREPDKRRSARRTISARRPIPRVEEKVRRDGGQEVKRKLAA